MEVDSSNSAKAMLTLYQETETARVCAKPWLRIGGQDYLYNYPTNSSDDMGIQADSSSSPITCEPSNLLSFGWQDADSFQQHFQLYRNRQWR